MYASPCMQKNTEDTIMKYAVDANLFRLGSSILKFAGHSKTLYTF